MKITFENYNNKQNVDKVKTTYSPSQSKKAEKGRGYALDISGTVMDNTAYGVQGRTAEDIMQQAECIDVTTQRNYMTVMSNSMSSEDFAKLQEEGYHPADVTIEETVTITDHIKAELAKAGVDVKGYTDQVSKTAMEEVAGSQASAQQIAAKLQQADAAVTDENIEQVKEAFEQASTLSELSEGAAKYMVENGMEPTIEEVYKAQFSGNADADRQGRGYYAEDTGYYSMKAEEYDWQQLQSQMEKVIEEAGLTVNEESLEQAKWLIEKGIPLTTENLGVLNEIESLELPMDSDQLLNAIAGTVARGKAAKQTNLADTETTMEKALRYAQFVSEVSDEAADLVVAEEKELNLKNLEEAQKRIDNGEIIPSGVNITARRKMEEIRLQMTVEANLKLLESGYQIETAELEQLVEELKAAENARNQVLFRTENTEEAQIKAALYEETRSKTEQIPFLPAATVGKAVFAEYEATIDTVYAQGTELKKAYEAAGESYETMMTSPRKDLGDSIQKAFRNVDEILKDLNLELTEQNRRAVRILGYNGTEITTENILAVKDADISIRKATDKMTPAATMEMIKEGINPLEMTVSELNEYFDRKDNEAEEQALKYSKYLYKLEQNNEITEAEREAYIGIYRFFRQMEKNDGAAIGAVLNAGGEVSFKNLMTAIRTGKKAGMDITVNDNFGGLADLITAGESITEQIARGFAENTQSGTDKSTQQYYEKLAKQISDNLQPEKIKNIPLDGNMTLEEFAARLDAADTNGELETAYREAQLKEYREAQNVDDETIRFLLDSGEEVTVNNLLAADKWLKKPGDAFKKMHSLHKEFLKSAKKLEEGFEDEISAKQGYEEFTEEVFGQLEEAAGQEAVTSLDVKEMHLLHKQIRLAQANAKQEEYQIPVQIGEEITAVRLRIIKGGEETGKVKVTMDTEKYGLAEAEFKVSGNTLEGFIAVSKEGTLEELKKLESKMKEALESSGLEISAFRFTQSSRIDTNSFMKEENTGDTEVSSVQLYGTAKAFLQAIQG